MEYRWYAIQTTAGHENKVRGLIAQRITEVCRPVIHERPALVEKIAAPIGRIGLVANRVCERQFNHVVAGRCRAFGRKQALVLEEHNRVVAADRRGHEPDVGSPQRSRSREEPCAASAHA